eukprot:36858-Eustigmatos_ZCMA.PRE.1
MACTHESPGPEDRICRYDACITMLHDTHLGVCGGSVAVKTVMSCRTCENTWLSAPNACERVHTRVENCGVCTSGQKAQWCWQMVW